MTDAEEEFRVWDEVLCAGFQPRTLEQGLLPLYPEINKGSEMTLIEEAITLANDIAEYAPNTNIEFVIRELIKEVEILQRRVIQLSTGAK